MKSVQALRRIAVLASAALLGGMALAQAVVAPPKIAASHAAEHAAHADMTEGEVRKVDKTAKSILIKHGEIKNLGMSPMTMLFHARDKKLLAKLTVGDKIRFKAAQQGGVLMVTEIQLTK